MFICCPAVVLIGQRLNQVTPTEGSMWLLDQFSLAYLFAEICGCFLWLEHERPVLPLVIIKGAVVTWLELRQETEMAISVEKKVWRRKWGHTGRENAQWRRRLSESWPPLRVSAGWRTAAAYTAQENRVMINEIKGMLWTKRKRKMASTHTSLFACFPNTAAPSFPCFTYCPLTLQRHALLHKLICFCPKS